MESSGADATGGHEDPEDPEIIDTTASQPLRGWRRVISDWLHHRVGHYVLTYDESTDSYTLDYDTISKKQVPKTAVHVTGEGDKCFFSDMVRSGRAPDPMHCTATDLYCWYKNNDLDDAIVSAHKSVPISKRTLIYVAVGIVAIALIMIFYL